jgi:hypothetical protein
MVPQPAHAHCYAVACYFLPCPSPTYPTTALAHLLLWQRADVCARLAAVDEGEVVLTGWAQRLDDQLQLVHVVLAREQRPPTQQLSQDAAHAPHVDCSRVVVAGQQQLGRTVPARDHVLSHEVALGAVRRRGGRRGRWC